MPAMTIVFSFSFNAVFALAVVCEVNVNGAPSNDERIHILGFSVFGFSV